MELIVLLFVLLAGPLALLFGADSRIDDVERRRRWQSHDQPR